MATIGLVPHHDRPEVLTLAADTAAWLRDGGHTVHMVAGDDATASVAATRVAPASFASGLDLVVSLGGDGCMLRTVNLVAEAGVPVIGVNLGQLGYLTEVEPAGLRSAIERFLDGRHGIDERMLLSVELHPAAGGVERFLALNEAVVERPACGHTVALEVSLDDGFFTTYVADALIVATPTGSTAYAFSARGPIVAPAHRALQLTPVSPHMLFDRTLVLDADTVVDILAGRDRRAILEVDGRVVADVEPGDRVRCTASPHVARVVSFGPRDFHRILKAKFGLSDR